MRRALRFKNGVPIAATVVMAALLGAGTAALGSPIPKALYSGLHWRLLGPFRGGRALAVTGTPGHPNRFYFGAVDGGVWESNDAGRTWKPIFDHEPVASIGAIAVAPSDPKVIYVGTGEADMRSDMASGNGVYRSEDGGKHWQYLGLAQTRHIGRIIVDPHNPNVVFVAALGHAYGPNSQRGVFKSTNGGRTWRKVLYKNANTGAIDLAFEPGHSNVVYAALWQTRRPPWGVYPPSNGPASGLYKSTDGGSHWQRISGHGFPTGVGRIGIGVSAAKPDWVYALVDDRSEKAGGLYRSENGGRTWHHVNGNERIWRRGWYFGGVTVDPENANIVYVCNTALYRSRDGGARFTPIKGSPGGDDYHHLWLDPTSPSHMIVGSDQGAVVSINNGKNWSSWYNQPTAQFYHVAVDNRDPFWVFGAQQDTGAAAVPFRTDNRNGITWANLHKIAAGFENGYIVPDPADNNIVYGDDDVVTKFWINTSENQTIDPTLAYPGVYRREWTAPLAVSPVNPKILYYATQRIFRSDNGGQSWHEISPDLTRKDPGIPSSLGSLTAKDSVIAGPRRGTVFAVAPSYQKQGIVWAGTDDGYIWLTKDGGKHWQNVTPAGLKSWSKVSFIAASHFNAHTAFVAIDRHRVNDDRPYIYRTTDDGRHWQLITKGIPDGDFVRVVREDPKRQGLLYAGTEKGIFVSFNDGGDWQSLQMNLPVTSIRDIAIHDKDLIVATHGRAFWAIDDITPLRQVDRHMVNADLWLYKPETAILLRPADFIGTPLPKDEPAAKNPPNGAVVYYYLAHSADRGVHIVIRNHQGKVVRRFSSRHAGPRLKPSRMTIAPDWLGYIKPPAPPSAAAGMHRFVWDLRCPLPKALWGPPSFYSYDFGRAGLWAPPGRYSVTVTANGHSRTEPLTVRPDPRMGVSDQALEAQYALGVKIEKARIRVEKAYQTASRLLDMVTKRLNGQPGKDTSILKRLQARIEAVAGSPPPANPDNSVGRPPRNLHSLYFLRGALRELENAEQSAETAPTATVQSGYQTDKATLHRVLRTWQRIMSTDIPSANAELRRMGAPTVK